MLMMRANVAKISLLYRRIGSENQLIVQSTLSQVADIQGILSF